MGKMLHKRAAEAGAKMTPQRVLICNVLERSQDHPDIETVHRKARRKESRISISACYRTMKVLTRLGLVLRHDFGDGRGRYEVSEQEPHDHLIDLSTGDIIEFHDPELVALNTLIAKRLGYELRKHSLSLYAQPIGLHELSPAPAEGQGGS